MFHAISDFEITSGYLQLVSRYSGKVDGAYLNIANIMKQTVRKPGQWIQIMFYNILYHIISFIILDNTICLDKISI